MTVEEHVVKQIKFLRDCFDEYRTDALDYSATKNAFENSEAIGGQHLINGTTTDAHGEIITLTNDLMRKAYVKEISLANSQITNRAKELRDTSAKKVEIEISVLSALKQLAGDENFDREILTRYDI